MGFERFPKEANALGVSSRTITLIGMDNYIGV